MSFVWPTCAQPQCGCHVPAARHSGGLVACAAAERRDVVPEGVTRFTSPGHLGHQPDWGQVSERVWCVLGGNPAPYTLNGTNCYLIGSGASRLLVDCGERNYGLDIFMKNLAECMEHVGCTTLCGIVVTHLHHDHFGGVDALQLKYGPGIPVYKSAVNPSTFATITAIQKHQQLHLLVDNHQPRFNSHNPATKLQQAEVAQQLNWLTTELGYDDQHLGEVTANFKYMWEAYLFYTALETGAMPWQELRHGTEITVPDGSATLRCMLTPGHSQDHCCFMLLEDNALLSGDTVLGHGTTVVFDMYDYMQSLDQLVCARPALLLPGHGPHSSDPMALLHRLIRHRRERELQVWRFLVENHSHSSAWQPRLTAVDVAARLYASARSPLQLRRASQNCYKILVGLYKEGHVEAECTAEPEVLFRESAFQKIGVTTQNVASQKIGVLQTEEVVWRAIVSDPSVMQTMDARSNMLGLRAKL